jgi:hypothetical protein
VRALPLAAGLNEGGHFFRYIFPLVLLAAVVKIPERVVVGIQIRTPTPGPLVGDF